MYEKVSPNLNFVEREAKVEQFWKDNQIFEKSVEEKEGCPVYTFYDGPPTANGKPHIGHVLTRVIKDMIPRYQTMKGHKIIRKAGWDTHGLPVELEVEKELGLDGKEQIEEYGLEPFIEKCKESVWKYKGMWEEFSGKVGFWADMDDPYVTYHNDFIESEWWALKEIWNKKLLYKGFKIVPYCPRCGTPLSAQEVSQGYKTVKERSAVVRFKVVGEDAYFLAWTTTPWTLAANVALTVGPDYDYLKVKMTAGDEEGSVFYVGKSLADKVLGEGNYEVIEEMKGSDLEYIEYEQLMPFVKADKKAFFVTCMDYVTTEDGTGIVHTAPAFGEDDYQCGRKYNLPVINPVNEQGLYTATPWEGRFVMEDGLDVEIIKWLAAENKIFAKAKVEHNYPHCWRCGTPLIYYAKPSWYIEMSRLKDQLVEANNKVNWYPDYVGEKRFGNWIADVKDWAISRNRYWGTPIPIWRCECGHLECIGSRAELVEKSIEDIDESIELHRPYVDDVHIKCPHCGKKMTRIPEVMDCWFDSGAMPFAQQHYPFENSENFDTELFPADFICEGIDQTRGWFYSLLAISTLLFNKAPYKNVIVLGLVLDKDGQKMSKSKGNAVDPFESLAEHGADAIRWYFYTNSAPWLPNRFHAKAVNEGQRKYISTLWNTYAFYVLYANIDNFDATKYTLDVDKLGVMDKWLLSRLNTVVGAVDDNLANYRIPEAARALQDFVDEMSNWYVRRSRERFWSKELTQDKINAYMTLYTALVNIAKTSAPMTPFVCDDIYRNLVCSLDKNAPVSVHLCDFPTVDEKLIDKHLEEEMDTVLTVVTLGRAARNAANIKNRQPISKIMVKGDKTLEPMYADIVKDELNIKEISFIDNTDHFTSYTFKPQLKTLGARFGKQIGEVRTKLAEVDGQKAMNEIRETGAMTLTLSTGDVQIAKDDLLIDEHQKEGYAVVTDRGYTIVLDTALTPELIEEGNVREIVSKIQTMRKDAGFEVMDHIVIYCDGSDKVAEILTRNKDSISEDTLADEIVTGKTDGFTKEQDINGESVTLGVKKI